MERKCSPDAEFLEELMQLTSDFEEIKAKSDDGPLGMCYVNTFARGRRIYHLPVDTHFPEASEVPGKNASAKVPKGRGRTYQSSQTEQPGPEVDIRNQLQAVFGSGSREVYIPHHQAGNVCSQNEQFEDHHHPELCQPATQLSLSTSACGRERIDGPSTVTLDISAGEIERSSDVDGVRVDYRQPESVSLTSNPPRAYLDFRDNRGGGSPLPSGGGFGAAVRDSCQKVDSGLRPAEYIQDDSDSDIFVSSGEDDDPMNYSRGGQFQSSEVGAAAISDNNSHPSSNLSATGKFFEPSLVTKQISSAKNSSVVKNETSPVTEYIRPCVSSFLEVERVIQRTNKHESEFVRHTDRTDPLNRKDVLTRVVAHPEDDNPIIRHSTRPSINTNLVKFGMFGNVIEGPTTWNLDSDFPSLCSDSRPKAKSKKPPKSSSLSSSSSTMVPSAPPSDQDAPKVDRLEAESECLGASAAPALRLMIENLPASVTVDSVLQFLEIYDPKVKVRLESANSGTKYNAIVEVTSEDNREYIISCLDGCVVPFEGSDDDGVMRVTEIS